MKNLKYFIPLLLCSYLSAIPIKSISFDGIVRLSTDTALELRWLRVGEELDIEKVDHAIKKLYLQSYFEDIWVEEDCGLVTKYEKEIPVVARL